MGSQLWAACFQVFVFQIWLARSSYIGCYRDEEAHDFSVMLPMDSGDCTIEACRKLAIGINLSFFGLQDGKQCFAGNRYGSYGKAPEEECSKGCAGNATQKCGGVARNAVFDAMVSSSRRLDEAWTVTSGSCTVDSFGCLLSPYFPGSYGDNEHCSIQVGATHGMLIGTFSFQTEAGYDYLTVNGRRYSGNVGPQGVSPSGTIEWSTDNSIGSGGWKLCLEASTDAPTEALGDTVSALVVNLAFSMYGAGVDGASGAAKEMLRVVDEGSLCGHLLPHARRTSAVFGPQSTLFTKSKFVKSLEPLAREYAERRLIGSGPAENLPACETLDGGIPVVFNWSTSSSVGCTFSSGGPRNPAGYPIVYVQYLDLYALLTAGGPAYYFGSDGRGPLDARPTPAGWNCSELGGEFHFRFAYKKHVWPTDQFPSTTYFIETMNIQANMIEIMPYILSWGLECDSEFCYMYGNVRPEYLGDVTNFLASSWGLLPMWSVYFKEMNHYSLDFSVPVQVVADHAAISTMAQDLANVSGASGLYVEQAPQGFACFDPDFRYRLPAVDEDACLTICLHFNCEAATYDALGFTCTCHETYAGATPSQNAGDVCLSLSYNNTANFTVLAQRYDIRMEDLSWDVALDLPPASDATLFEYGNETTWSTCEPFSEDRSEKTSFYCKPFGQLKISMLGSQGVWTDIVLWGDGNTSLKDLLSSSSGPQSTYLGASAWSAIFGAKIQPTPNFCGVEEGVQIDRPIGQCRFGAMMGHIYQDPADRPNSALDAARAQRKKSACKAFETPFALDCIGLDIFTCNESLTQNCDGFDVEGWVSEFGEDVLPHLETILGNGSGQQGSCPLVCDRSTSYQSSCNATAGRRLVANNSAVMGATMFSSVMFGFGCDVPSMPLPGSHGMWSWGSDGPMWYPTRLKVSTSDHPVAFQVSRLDVFWSKANGIIRDVQFIAGPFGGIDNPELVPTRMNIAVGDYIVALSLGFPDLAASQSSNVSNLCSVSVFTRNGVVRRLQSPLCLDSGKQLLTVPEGFHFMKVTNFGIPVWEFGVAPVGKDTFGNSSGFQPLILPQFCSDPELRVRTCFVNPSGVNCPTIASLNYTLNRGVPGWEVDWNFSGGVTEALSCLSQDPTIAWTNCTAPCRYKTSFYEDAEVSEFVKSREQLLSDHASSTCSKTCLEEYNWMGGSTVANPGSQVPTVPPTGAPTADWSLSAQLFTPPWSMYVARRVGGTSSNPEPYWQLSNGERASLNLIYWNQTIQNEHGFEISFDLKITSDSRADGLFFFIGARDLNGGEWGFNGAYTLSFELYIFSNQLGNIIWIDHTLATKAIYKANNEFRTGDWQTVRVIYTRGAVNTWSILWKGISIINYNDPSNSAWVSSFAGPLYGFGYRSGDLAGTSFVRRVSLPIQAAPTKAPTDTPIEAAPTKAPTDTPIEVCYNFVLNFADCMTCSKLDQVNLSSAWPWSHCSARPIKVKFNYTEHPKALPTLVRFGYKLGVAAKDAKGFGEETQREQCSKALGIKPGACTLAMRFEVRQMLKASPPMERSVMEDELAMVYNCGFPDAAAPSDNKTMCSLITTRRLQTIQPAPAANFDVTINTLLLELFQIAASPASEAPNITNASLQGDPVSFAFINAVIDVAAAGDSPEFTQLLNLMISGDLANASILLSSLYNAVGLNITVDASSFDLGDPFLYLPTDYGDCHGCGTGGIKYRQASCIGSDGNATNDSFCSGYPMPDLLEKCWGPDCGTGLAVVAIALSVFGGVCGCCCVFWTCFIRKWRRAPTKGTLQTDESVVGVKEIEWEIEDNRESEILPTGSLSRLYRTFGKKSDETPADGARRGAKDGKRHIIWKVTEDTFEKFKVAEAAEESKNDNDVSDGKANNASQEEMPQPRTCIPIYKDSDRVEYFSESHSIWLLGTIEVVVLPDQSVVYYNVVLTTKQIRWNVPLHLIRRPLKPLDPVCVFDPTRYCWKHAFISPATIPDQTLHGYRIHYVLPQKDDRDLPEMELAPATTTVLRFPPDSNVDVYKGHQLGWRPAIVIDFIEETPPPRPMPVDNKAQDKTSVEPQPPTKSFFESGKRPTYHNGDPIGLWCKAEVRYTDDGTKEQVDTWLLRWQVPRMQEPFERAAALLERDEELPV